MKRTRTYIATICALALVLCFYTQQSAMAEIGHTLVTLPENDDVASDTNLGDNQWCLIGPPYRPQRPGAVRVIISALHDTNYHSGTDRDGSNFQYQSEDGVVEVTARVRVDWNSDALDQLPDKRDALAQKILGTPVWFLVMDPPDESVYIANGLNRLQGETQHYIGDNHDPTIKRGKLSAAPTYTAWAETIVKDGNTIGIAVLPKYVRTEHSGNMDYRIYEAKVRLETTHRYGGDNYIVLARFNEMNPTKYQDSSGKHVLDVSMNPFTDKGKYAWGCSPSGTMYAWKRIYLEVDTMFRTGSYLVANAAAGQKQIQLASVAGLAANDKIYVFGSHDVNTDKCEAAEIESINQDTKTITVKANLTNAYNKGVKDNDAAIGKRILKANGDIDDAATFYTIPDYISDVLKQCYEPAFDEFVEVPDPQFEAMNFPKGRGWLPYDASVAPGADERERNLNLQVFSQRWFKNKEPRADDLLLLPDDQLHNVEPHRAAQNTGKENYFHLMLSGPT